MSVWSPSGSGEVHVDSVLPSISIGWSLMPYEVRMTNGRHCVYKKGTDQSMGCHDTHGEALEQVAALYAKEGGKMSDTASYLISMDTVTLSENESTKWIHALPLGSYKHPIYGAMDIDVDRVTRYADSVKKKVRGIDPSINYNHDNDSPEGASGWVKDAEVRSNGLWLFVDFVKDAVAKIRDKKFRYFSVEFANEWEDPEGKKFKDVVIGGALTNRPFMKNLVPINLSESVIDNAFDLVSAITGKPEEQLKGNSMDDKDLQKIIDGVTAKLSEQVKVTQPKPIETPVSNLKEVDELRKLAEDNPVINKLFGHFESQAQQLIEQKQLMRETMVDSKLSEFDNSKLTLTPSSKELAREIMLGIPEDMTGKFIQFIESVRASTSFLVELGERSGAAVRRGFNSLEKSATQLFSERTNELMANEKISFLEAVDRVAREDPKLYEAYRMGDGAPTSVN